MPFLDLEVATGVGDALLDLSVDLNQASIDARGQGQLNNSVLSGMGLLSESYSSVVEALTQRMSDLGATMETDGTAVLLCVSLYDEVTGGVRGG